MPFISVTGSDFMEMFVGVGASRVRDLFKTARANAPCIIFIDELDSIGRKRGAGLGGGHDEREQTLNQLLGEIDGFEASTGVVIIGATNRPDVLDPALQRPGRFDRQIVVPLPTLEEREQILRGPHQRQAARRRTSTCARSRAARRAWPARTSRTSSTRPRSSPCASGSDEIRIRDLEHARERQTIGRERASLRLDEDEKRAVAYHEGGHALAAFLEDEADPVYKVTVLPVGMALGVTTQLPIDERHIYTRSWLDAKLKVMLGGRAAELVVLGEPTTGGQHDLVQATKLARAIVRDFGMSDALGPGRVRRGPAGLPRRGARPRPRVLRRDRRDHRHRGAPHPRPTPSRRVVASFAELRPGLDAMADLLVERESISGQEALEAVRNGLPPHLRERLRGKASEVKTVEEKDRADRDGQSPTPAMPQPPATHPPAEAGARR